MSFNTKFLCTALMTLSLASCRNSSVKINPNPINEVAVNPKSTAEDLQLNGAVASQVVLENGLKVIVVSSPTSKFSSAAVGAQVGFSDDPVDAQGLSHFLEHMLFLGTKEFPVVGQYKQFLEANSGGSNAYTSSNHTNYYLQIRSDKFDEAVNRLSRFFVNPLFDKTFVEKEKSAVHNEFNLRFEDRKPNRAFMAFNKVEGQFRGFGVGNEDTLREATAEDTRKLFEKHYYAENMHAVLSGPQSIRDLKELARKYFSDIKSNPQGKKNVYDQTLKIDLAQLPAQLNIKANDQTKSVEFFIPTMNPSAENKAARAVVGSLLGDESPESLMVVLQEKGLARPGAGAISGAAYPSGVNITVQLSDEGFKKIEETAEYVLGYIAFLKNQELPAYLDEENKLSNAASKIAAEYFDVTSSLTQGLNRAYFSKEGKVENWKTLFLGETNPAPTDADYKAYLNDLNKDKMLVQITHPSIEELDYDFVTLGDIDKAGVDIKTIGTKKAVVDSLYKFAYEVESFNAIALNAKGDFKLKTPNAYIPRAFEIYKDGESTPYTANTSDWGRIYTTDVEETVLPKVFMNLEMYSDKVDFSQKSDAAALFLMREMLRQQSSSQSYAMLTAGFNIEFPIYIGKGAIGFNFNGWSDTYKKAFADTVGATNLSPKAEEFEELKAFYQNQIALEASGSADGIGRREMLSGVFSSYLSFDDLGEALAQMDHTSYLNFVERYFSGLHIRGALTGNLKKESLGSLMTTINEAWNPKWAAQDKWESLYSIGSFTSGDAHNGVVLREKTLQGPSKSNSLYTGFWSFGEATSVKERFVAIIMGQWLGPDYYEELRTKRQLAYSLYAIPWAFNDELGMRINLLSSTADADTIESEVDGFIAQWAQEILPAKSEDLVTGTINNILLGRVAPASTAALHTHYSNLMTAGYVDVEEYQAETSVLKEISLKDVVDFGQAKLLKRGKSGSFVKVTKKEDELILAP